MARAFDAGFGPGFGGPHSFGTVLLKVGSNGPDPAYQDGDLVVALNRRRTRQVHAEHICHSRAAPRQGNGLIALSHHARDYAERVYQYRFERVSATEVLRTNLVTLATSLVGATPNVDGESMNVAEFVQRRRARADVAMYGVDGSEVWYGGSLDLTHAALDAVWTMIETRTTFREVDHADWPLGIQEARTMLALRVDDFDDAEAGALMAAVMDETDPENPMLVRKRTRRVQWRALRDMTPARIAAIENRQVAVDIRAERKFIRAVTIEVK